MKVRLFVVRSTLGYVGKSSALYLIAILVFAEAHGQGIDIKLPMKPGQDWLVTNPIDGHFAHVGSYAIDISGRYNETPILASASGIVEVAKVDLCDNGKDICVDCADAINERGFGNVAVLREGLTSEEMLGNYVKVDIGGGYEIYYAHLACGSVEVSQGQPVKQGDILGKVGLSGSTSGPHLHLEIRFNNQVKIPIEEIDEMTMEGRPLAEYLKNMAYPSTNRPGLDLVQLSVEGVDRTLIGAGTYAASVRWKIQNNNQEDRRIETITIRGSKGGHEEILANQVVVGEIVAPGEENASSGLVPVVVSISEPFVGRYFFSALFTDNLGDMHVGSQGDSLFVVADSRSVLVDDSSEDFSFNTDEDILSGPGGLIGDVGYVFSNKPHVVGTWKPSNLEPGRYEVLVYIPEKNAVSSAVKYTVTGARFFGSGPRLVRYRATVNQGKYVNQWLSLGRRQFSEKFHEISLSPIVLSDNFRVGYDAVLFRYTGDLDDFYDVEAQDWFYESVSRLQELHIVAGRKTSNGVRFEPASKVLRAEMLKMVMMAADYKGHELLEMVEEVAGSDLEPYFDLLYSVDGVSYPPFSDVDMSHWWFRYVMIARLLDIVSPSADGLFRPEDTTQRVEAMKMLVEAFQFDLSDGSGNAVDYTDIDRSEWYIDYVRLLDKYGIVQGFDDGSLKPGEAINRAEAAALVARAIESYELIPKR